MLRKVKGSFKNYLRKRLLKRSDFDNDSDPNVPASLNNTFNYVMALSPRVTSFAEHITLFNLSAVTSGNIIEIGSYLCYSSAIMASAFAHGDRKLYAIDPFERLKGWSNGGTDDWIFASFSQREFAQKVLRDTGLEDRIIVKEGFSKDFVSELGEVPHLSLLFVDAAHTYEGVKADLLAYSPMVDEGGYLALHDYNCPRWPGVKEAVDEFLADTETFTPVFLVDSMLVTRRKG